MSAIIKPQDGPQMMAARSKARIVVFGGGAGGGKSWLQAWRAARYVHTPGYNAAIFRRTFPMLKGSGSILDEQRTFYPELGGLFHQNDFEWRFPAPARVELKQLQHEKNALDHKSKQYAYLGFDEGSEFVGSQFFFMNSRLRTTCGVPKQFMVTTNPDPDCFLRALLDWWIGLDGFPIPERAGVVRFWIRLKDEIVWADSEDDLLKYVDGDPNSVMSLTFIPSLVTDNKVLMTKDPSYMANLKSMTSVDRERYLSGNWNIKNAAGDYFVRSAFKQWASSDLQRALLSQDGPSAKIVQSIRVWDFASTPVSGNLVPGIQRPLDFKGRDPATDDPDWTCSVRLDRVRNGRVIVSDVTFHRDTPGAVQQLLERTAVQDGPKVTVGIFRDPGQAGDDQAERLARIIRRHSPCAVLDTANKEWHAREPARAAWRGEMYYVDGPWNIQFFNQLETFPTPKEKDDAVVALSGAYRWLQENAPPAFSYENPMETLRQYDATLADPRKARELLDKKTRRKVGVERVDVQATKRWGRRNY